MRAFTIKHSDVARCPKHSIAPAHYRNDGTCRCTLSPDEAQDVIRRAATAFLHGEDPETVDLEELATALRVTEPKTCLACGGPMHHPSWGCVRPREEGEDR